MTRIIAYAYEADVHCLDCAQARFGLSSATGHYVENNGNPVQKRSYGKPGVFSAHLDGGVHKALDEHLIPYDAVDREGNPVHPIFSTDEQPEPLYCGDCLEEI